MSARIFTGYVVAKAGQPVQGVLAVLKDDAWTQAEEKLGMERTALERDHGYALVEVELWSKP